MGEYRLTDRTAREVARWLKQQDLEYGEAQAERARAMGEESPAGRFPYYGAIGGSRTRVMETLKGQVVNAEIQHWGTKRTLNLPLDPQANDSPYRAIGTPEPLTGCAQDPQGHYRGESTLTSRGEVLKVTDISTHKTYDLSDYEDW